MEVWRGAESRGVGASEGSKMRYFCPAPKEQKTGHPVLPETGPSILPAKERVFHLPDCKIALVSLRKGPFLLATALEVVLFLIYTLT